MTTKLQGGGYLKDPLMSYWHRMGHVILQFEGGLKYLIAHIVNSMEKKQQNFLKENA